MNKAEISAEIWRKISLVYRIMLGMLAVLALITAYVLRTYPTTHAVKMLLISTLIFAAITGLVALAGTCKHRPKLLYPMLFFAAFIFVWIILGSKEPDTISLRNIYVSRLKAHENVAYLPGGETYRGVDGVGLAKAALWQAMVIEGLRELNPRLFGPDMWRFWLTDLSIEDLISGKHLYTRYIDRPACLIDYDSFLLDRGDLAITYDGSDLMIYAGGENWVYADKTQGKVRVLHTVTGKSAPEPFKKSIHIVRWWIFDK